MTYPSDQDPADGAPTTSAGVGHDPATGPAASPAHPRGLDERGRPRGGKVSALWIGLIVAAVLLIVLLIFIAQNSVSVPVHFLGASGHVPLAVALLLAAVIAVLLVAIPGSVRIMQLRRLVKRTGRRREEDSR